MLEISASWLDLESAANKRFSAVSCDFALRKTLPQMWGLLNIASERL